MLVINESIEIPLREFDFDFVRSSGPGGQRVNKVSTKAVLRWNVAESDALSESVQARFLAKFHRRIGQDGFLTITSQRFRDRGRNVADCLNKLRGLVLEVATPAITRKKTRPTKASKSRRKKNKQLQSEKKQRRRPPTLE